MHHSIVVCNGDECLFKCALGHSKDIRAVTDEWAAAHRMHNHGDSYFQASSSLAGPSTQKVLLLVSIQSRPGCWNYNSAAANDILLILGDNKVQIALANPNTLVIIITDVPNVRNILEMPLHSAVASVRVLRPTRDHVEFGVRFATSILRPGDECTMSFGCYSKKGTNAFQLADPMVAVTGKDLRRWMIEHTNPHAVIRVILDVSLSLCHKTALSRTNRIRRSVTAGTFFIYPGTSTPRVHWSPQGCPSCGKIHQKLYACPRARGTKRHTS
ncbi:hypothetical protein FRB94_001158 [Tulasnella sp. JGI-2019a]|nr:hypothetical protein FRB94_001158 [Tulasnella sp. JGI-2019a]